MSSSGQDLDRYKPPDMSQEEWDEITTELEEKKTNNSDHHTVQLKVKKSIKYLIPVVLIPILGVSYFLALRYQAMVMTGLGFAIVIAFLYYASVEQGAGEQ